MHCVSYQTTKNLVTTWLSENSTHRYPLSGLVNSNSTLVISSTTPGVLAGVPFIDAIVDHLDCKIEWHVKEGQSHQSSQTIASITGPVVGLVRGELLVKNILSRASSIATFASRLKQLLSDFSWKGELVSPYMHTPGFAFVEEYAIFVAGIPSSRNVSSVLLPLSHVTAAGGVKEAIAAIKIKAGKNTQINVECSNLQDAKAAAEAGASCIRFDGLSSKDLGNFSAQLKSSYPSMLIEASGNFDETTLRQFSLPYIDSLTTKKLYNGYPVVEFTVNYELVDGATKSSNVASVEELPAASADSEHSPADNGIPNVGKESGDDASVKIFDAEPKTHVPSSPVINEPTSQKKTDVEKPKPSPTPLGKKTEKANGIRGFPVNAANRRLLNRPPQTRAQQWLLLRQQQSQGNRGVQQNRRNGRQPHLQSGNFPVSAVTRGGAMSANVGSATGFRNHQSPQQQTAAAFLHQARMMSATMNPRGPNTSANGGLMSAAAALLSSQQAVMRRPMVSQRGLIGSGAPNQWSIMGGPPHRGAGGGVCCRVCGAQIGFGMPFCRNCRAPTR